MTVPDPGQLDEQAQQRGLDEREIAREQHDRRGDCRAHRHRRAARPAGPRPAGPPRTAGNALTPGPTSITGSHTSREHARAARRERLAVDDETRLVGPHAAARAAREQHARHLAHGDYAGRSSRRAGSASVPVPGERVADDGPTVGAAFEQHVVAHGAALGRHTRDDQRASGCPSTNVSMSMCSADSTARLVRVRGALRGDELVAPQPVAQLGARRGRTAGRSRARPTLARSRSRRRARPAPVSCAIAQIHMNTSKATMTPMAMTSGTSDLERLDLGARGRSRGW